MRCCWRARRSSSFAISSRAASESSEARSSAMRFSSSRSGFSNSSSSGIFDEYTARPQEGFDFRDQGGRRLHAQLLHPQHHLLLGEQHVHEERGPPLVLAAGRLQRGEQGAERLRRRAHPDAAGVRRLLAAAALPLSISPPPFHPL